MKKHNNATTLKEKKPPPGPDGASSKTREIKGQIDGDNFTSTDNKVRASVQPGYKFSIIPTTVLDPALIDGNAEEDSGLEDGEEEQSKQEVSEADQYTQKKTLFRKYLTTSGFKYAIIRSFVALYEDEPKTDDPLAWILGFVGYGIPTLQELETSRLEAKDLREKIVKLQSENNELKVKVEEREGINKSDPYSKELKKMIDELTEQGEFAVGGVTSDK